MKNIIHKSNEPVKKGVYFYNILKVKGHKLPLLEITMYPNNDGILPADNHDKNGYLSVGWIYASDLMEYFKQVGYNEKEYYNAAKNEAIWYKE